MATSKRAKAFIVTGIIWVPFFVFKLFNLASYNFYDGTIINIEEAMVSVPKVHRSGGGYQKVYIPEVQYIRNSDTVVFSEGTRSSFSYFYNVGDSVTVIEDKDNTDKTNILAPWYYIKIYEVILVILLSCIVGSIYWGVSTGYFKEK